MDPQTPPVIPSQTPAVTNVSRKRKRAINFDSIIDAFDVEPKDYEAAWNNLKSRIIGVYTTGHVSTLAPSSLTSLNEALQLFNLYEAKIDLFTDLYRLPIPQYLEESIFRIYSVTNGGSQNEAFSQTILDQILICILYEEGNRSDKQPKEVKSSSNLSHAHPSTSEISLQDEEDPAKLELLHEMPLSRPVTHQGEAKLLTGFADYSFWYGSPKKKTLATNLVIIEAKRQHQTDVALPQLAAYMGIVYATRKEESEENCVVYGASSDGRTFRFCRIDNDGVFVTSRLLEWAYDKDQIYSIMRSLLRAAARSSPSTTPIKDPMQRKIVLSSFGSPQRSREFDYGLGKLEVFHEGDVGKEDYEIVDI